MNERIQELAEQAHVYAGGHSLWCHAGDVEKFAELIVRECAELATKEYNNRGAIHGNDLLQHFGVAE
jgi:hypothetical protein